MKNTIPLTPTIVSIVASSIAIILVALWVSSDINGGFAGIGIIFTTPLPLITATAVAALSKSPTRGWFIAKVTLVAFAWTSTIASFFLPALF